MQASDSRGEILWRARLPEHKNLYTKILVRDVDADGRNEVLVSLLVTNLGVEGGYLYCFDESGNEVWSYPYNRNLTVRDRDFDPLYYGHTLKWIDALEGSFILLILRQVPFYPTLIILLDPPTGSPVSEYWHPGPVISPIVLEENGRSRLLLGGTNNPGPGLGHASLAVLMMPFGEPEPDRSVNFFGSHNQLEELYLVFPRLDVFEIQDLGLSVQDMTLSGMNGANRLKVEVRPLDQAGIIYYLDPSTFEVIDLYASDGFKSEHNRLYRDGHLDHPYHPDELSRWRRLARFATAPDGNSVQVLTRFADQDGASD